MAWTPTPEQEIAVSERDRTLLVSAAAGAGKTSTLIRRIITTLTDPDGKGDLSRMLIVTFTRAAAAELRERISDALSAAMASGTRTAHLSRQLLALPTAKISTIDSFCLDLIRAHAGKLGISPAFRLADGAENKLLLSSIMNRLIEDCYDGTVDGVSPEAFVALADCLATGKGVSKIDEVLLSLYDKVRNYGRSYHLIEDAAKLLSDGIGKEPFDTPWGRYIKKRTEGKLSAFPARLHEILPRAAADDLIGKKYPDLIASDLDAVNTLLRAVSDGDYTATKAAFEGVKKMRTPTVPGASGYPPAEEVKELHNALHKEIAALRTKFYLYTAEEWGDVLAALSEKAALTARLLAVFSERVDAEKRRRGMLSFSDLSRYAYLLLCEEGGGKTPLAEEMSRDFDYIYVDEYQDVNEVQHRIFEALAHPRARFMVGDVKQSIYGFRGAQPHIFASLREEFPDYDHCGEGDAAVLSLAANFRSDPAVLHFVNRIFGRHMEGGLAKAIGYVEEADRLNPKKPETGERVRVALFGDESYDPSDAPISEGEEDTALDASPATVAGAAEADYVADEIARLLGSNLNGRTLAPGDFAILTRTREAAGRFVLALSARGIKCEQEADDAFFLKPEILLLLSLLNTIDNPRRDVYLAGLLLSPLYGFSMDDLITVRNETRADGDGMPLYEAILAYYAKHPSDARITRFLSDLDRYRRMAEGCPAHTLIWQLYRETGLLSAVGAGADGESAARRASLLLFYDYARRFEASSYRGLYNFISYITQAIAQNESIEETGAKTARPDTVRVMTMHQSKGLEFPVCFVCDCGHSFNLTDSHDRALFDRDYGLAVKLRDKSGYGILKNPVYNVISSLTVDRAVEENLRLFYVALTRAVDRLYVTATVKDAEKQLQKRQPTDVPLDETVTYACRTHADLLFTALGVDSSYDLFVDGSPFLPVASVAAAEAQAASADAAHPEKTCADGETELAPTFDQAQVAAYAKTLEERFSFVYPDAHLSKIAGKYAVSQLHPRALDESEAEIEECPLAIPDETEEGEAPQKRTVPRFLGGEQNNAAQKGTATHLFMQFCDFARTGKMGVKDELDRLVCERFLSPEDAALVRVREVEQFLKTSLFTALTEKGARLWRELRFHARFAASAFVEDESLKATYEKETVLVQGVMDAVLETASGKLWLIDYKTDRVKGEEELRVRHATQLSYYTAACRDIFGRLPDRVLIYSLALGRAIDLPVTLPAGI